jgi:hypothetical protein
LPPPPEPRQHDQPSTIRGEAQCVPEPLQLIRDTPPRVGGVVGGGAAVSGCAGSAGGVVGGGCRAAVRGVSTGGAPVPGLVCRGGVGGVSGPVSSAGVASAADAGRGVEAAVCELRRAHPRWGPRRLEYELLLGAPSEFDSSENVDPYPLILPFQ